MFGMNLLGIPEAAQQPIVARWLSENKPPLRTFAPYFHHVYSVDLFFSLAIAADQISRARPSNKIDLAYVYYLPFCQVFTSSDKLHERVVPLFLRADQSFVKGHDLKVDLRKLDDHYSNLPEEVKKSGLYKFADRPPADSAFLVTRLWDTHLPGWRELKAKKEPPDQSQHKDLIAELNRIEAAAQFSSPSARISVEETAYVALIRNVQRRKGKWERFGPEIK